MLEMKNAIFIFIMMLSFALVGQDEKLPDLILECVPCELKTVIDGKSVNQMYYEGLSFYDLDSGNLLWEITDLDIMEIVFTDSGVTLYDNHYSWERLYCRSEGVVTKINTPTDFSCAIGCLKNLVPDPVPPPCEGVVCEEGEFCDGAGNCIAFPVDPCLELECPEPSVCINGVCYDFTCPKDSDGDGKDDDDEAADGTDPNDPCVNSWTAAEICGFCNSTDGTDRLNPMCSLDCDGGGIINSVECDNGGDPTDGGDDVEECCFQPISVDFIDIDVNDRGQIHITSDGMCSSAVPIWEVWYNEAQTPTQATPYIPTETNTVLPSNFPLFTNGGFSIVGWDLVSSQRNYYIEVTIPSCEESKIHIYISNEGTTNIATLFSLDGGVNGGNTWQ